MFLGHGIARERWAMLTNADQSEATEKGSNITLKKLCPTRWESRYDKVSALRHRYSDMMKALSKIGPTSQRKRSGMKQHH